MAIALATFQNSVIYSFFYSENDIELLICILKAFRLALYSSIPIQHVQDAVLGVAD